MKSGAFNRNNFVHFGKPPHQRRKFLGNEKMESGVREIIAHSVNGGQREYNIADGLEPDEQDVYRARPCSIRFPSAIQPAQKAVFPESFKCAKGGDAPALCAV